MNFIDIGMFLIVLLFTLIGYKKGVIRTSVQLIGIVVIAFVSYMIKTPLANFLIDVLPFYNFGGVFNEIESISILFYHGLAFLFVFIMLYSLLNILLIFAGILDKILKATIILYLPNKILGGIVGFIEGVIISFILIFILVQIPNTTNYVTDSSYGYTLLNRTPVIRTVLATTTSTAESIAIAVDKYEDTEDIDALQIEILNIMIEYRLITASEVQDLIDEGKIDLPLVTFG